MIQFFNPHATGDEQSLYNGEWPYIHWAEPFSVGVIRYKTIYFISDKKNITVRIDAKRNPFTGSLVDWNFALYNRDHVDSELYAIDWNYFCGLHAVATDSVRLEGQKVQLSNGAVNVDVYAYQLIIICHSDVEGEFIETFYLDNVPYKVGAEFYGENESLKINLANQGTEIPSIVAKAIYGTDLYEENVDWVLLNRKFRELLTNHLDIMDNKGSYKSLLNSLSWFEYDKLVELREVWKYTTPDGTKYFDCPVQTMVSDGIRERMFNAAKTTYFALRHLKRNIVGHEEVEVEDPIIKYQVNAIPGANSTTAAPVFMVNRGDSVTAIFYANTGYKFADGSTEVRKTITNVQAHQDIIGPDAARDELTVRVVAGKHSTTPLAEIKVSYGGSVSVTFTADEGYSFNGDNTVTKTESNITSNITITGPDAAAIMYTVTIKAGSNSTADKVTQQVSYGSSISVTFTANDGYTFDIDNMLMPTVTTTKSNITSDITITGPDAVESVNPFDNTLDEIPSTPYIRWYPVHGDLANVGGEIYDAPRGGDVLPHVYYTTKGSALALAKPIYVTAETQADKLALWDDVANKSGDLTWHYEGPCPCHFIGFYKDVYDPAFKKALDSYAEPTTYMRAIICANNFGADSDLDEAIVGTHKVWCEWRGQKSNVIEYVIEDGTWEDIRARHPELDEWVEQHPVVQSENITNP